MKPARLIAALGVIVVLCAAAVPLQAQNSSGGQFPLNATVDTVGTVVLTWAPPSAGSVQKYLIYRAPVSNLREAPDSSSFRLIDSVANTTTRYVDHPRDSVEGFAYVVAARMQLGMLRSSVAIVPRTFRPEMPPIFLTARIDDMSAAPGFKVNLEWKVRDGLNAQAFVIMRAGLTEGQDPSSVQFSPIDTVAGVFRASDFPPVNEFPAFAYVVVLVPSAGDPIPSNPALIFARPVFHFPLAAAVRDSGAVVLEWPPLHDSLNVPMYYIRRAHEREISHGVAPAVIDSISGISRYVDRPPVSDEGGSFIYQVTARLASGMLLHSRPAPVYFHPKMPPSAIRLEATFHTPDTIRMKWERPENTDVVKYYVMAAFVNDPGIMAPNILRVVDSTTNRFHQLIAPSGAVYAYVAVAALTPNGRLIPSNGVPLSLVGPRPEPPRLSGTVTDTGTVLLRIQRPSSIAGAKAFIYRAPIDTPSVVTHAVSWTLVDSTTGETYLDAPAGSQLGYVYIVRVFAGGHRLESNPYVAILRSKLYLQVFPEPEGTIRLVWTPVLNFEPTGFVVYRQVLRDSALTVNPTGGTPVDTVRGLEWKDRPRETDALGYAYKVVALGSRGPVESAWHRIRWHRPVAQPFVLGVRIDLRGTVKLHWTDPFQVPPLNYVIMRATLSSNTNRVDTLLFARIDSVPGTVHEYADEPPLGQSNAFGYRVDAYSAAGLIMRTNPVGVLFPSIVPRVDAVRITSEPLRSGQVGQPYQYQAAAVSSDSTATIRWFLVHGPQGMSVDSSTGVVDWLPFSRGLYRVVLAAASDRGGRAFQEYVVAVAAGVGSVEGVVQNASGQPIPRVAVKLFKRDALTPFEYVRVTDSSGQYRFDKVEVGTYAAFAVDLTGRYKPEWWFDKGWPSAADPVVVADSAVTTVDFVLENRAEVQPFTSAGTVRDTNGVPIENAVVVYARAEYMLNSAKHLGGGEGRGENVRDVLADMRSGEQLGSTAGFVNNAPPVVTTLTGADGSYSVTLTPGAYIAVSYAPGYRRVFYRNTTDLLRARILRLNGDTTGIDFTLIPVPNVPLATLSGSVLDTAGTTGIPARVIAFRLTGDVRRVDSYYAETDATGGFSIPNVRPGEYVLLAIPLGHYAPSFYSLTGPTLRWRLATRVSVTGNDVGGLVIFVRPLTRTAAGITSIDGAVSEPGAPGRTMSRTFAAGVDGSIVTATTSTGAIAGYGVTDENGAYTIEGLAPGTYTVTADRFGYDEPTSKTVSPTYDQNGNPVSGTADFNVATTTTSVEASGTIVPTEYTLSQNYPNPFNPTTQIVFTIPVSERVTVDVFNILGQKVATLTDGVLPAGTHTAVWNGRTGSGIAASSGVYFYTLRTPSFQSVKRMVLLR